MRDILSVSALNQYIKGVLERDYLLSGVTVRGEISNYKVYGSGHHYFTLKDESGSISGVMFRGDAARLRFRPENGMSVLCTGRVSVYPRDGKYQLICSAITPDGVGALAVAFEQLKRKLGAEGLFDETRKRPLPRMPRRIALVTSPESAAVRDMIRILGARWPMAEIVVIPSRVQGAEAPEELCRGIALANTLADPADLIIIGRGGGSMEDLWAFNDENLARAICASALPVISAVGHEPDYTISDFAADRRASTPSNAAEIAVPDCRDMAAALSHMAVRLRTAQERRIRRQREKLSVLAASPFLRSPKRAIEEKEIALDMFRQRMQHSMERTLDSRRQMLALSAASLEALSPVSVLARGYSFAQKGDALITGVGQVTRGDTIRVSVSDGSLRCTVTEIEEGLPWQTQQ